MSSLIQISLCLGNVYDYCRKNFDLQITKKKAKLQSLSDMNSWDGKRKKYLEGMIPYKCSQQITLNIRHTVISSHIIQIYGELSLEVPYLLWMSTVCLIAFHVVKKLFAC